MKKKLTNRIVSLLLSTLTVIASLPLLGLWLGINAWAADAGADIASVPAVRDVTYGTGTFTLTSAARFYIVSDTDPSDSDVGLFVQTVSSEFAAKGIPSAAVLPIVYGDKSFAQSGDIVIIPNATGIKSQGYKLTVTSSCIMVEAGDAAGILNGLHTVLQSMIKGGTTLKACVVSDYPDVAERSVYLDCGRIYFAPETIKALIRTASWNKMNVLYLDFSNNNATRFFLDEMKVTVSGKTYDITTAKPSDGYLSQSDMDDILAEAAKYGVRIIPTFNSPGHIGGIRSVNSSFFESASASDYDSGTGKVALNILDSAAYTFGQEVVKLYVDYFASKGCKSFNIAADEVTDAISGLNSTNSTFVSYVNDLNTYIRSKGMTTRMFNDGLKNVTDGIAKDIHILYWTTEDVNALIDAGYSVLNLNCHAGLYYAYCQGLSSAYVWNQDVDKIYAGWNPGVTSCTVHNWGSSSYAYTPSETISDYANEEKLLGTAFAIWTDYAFNRGKDGTTIFAENYKNMMQKIYTVAERSWSTVCTDSYSTWSGKLLPAPAGLSMSGSVLTETLPAASSITLAGSNVGTNPTIPPQTLIDEESGITVTVTPSGNATEYVYSIGISISVTYTSKRTAKVTVSVTITENEQPYTNGAVLNIPYDTWNEYLADSGFGIDEIIEFSASVSGDSVDVKRDDENKKLVLTVPHFSDVEIDATIANDSDAVVKKETIELKEGQTHEITIEGVDLSGTYKTDNESIASVKVECVKGTPASTTTTVEYKKDSDVTCSGLVTASEWTKVEGYYCKVGDNYYQLWARCQLTNIFVITRYNYTWGYKTSDSQATPSDIGTQETYSSSAEPNIDVYKKSETTVTVPETKDVTTITFTAKEGGITKVTIGDTEYTVKVNKDPVTVTVNCVCDGKTIYSKDIKADFNYNGGYNYTLSAPAVSGYAYKSGNLSGTVTGATTITLTYEEQEPIVLPDSITLPISIIDYRSDGLLFDYNYNDDDSYAYSLVHSYTKPAHGSYDCSTSYGTSFDGSNYGTAIKGTKLEIARRFTGDISGSWNYNYRLNGGWIRTGMVEPLLGANGLPVYTSDTVYAVANLLRQGVYSDGVAGSSKITNKEFINTFLSENAARSVLADTTPTEMSAAFKNAQTYDNINNAYDLAWWMLNNLYTADTNYITDNGKTVPIYGMATNTYTGIVLKKVDDIGNGSAGYVYDSAYATTYDKTNGYIYNTDTPGAIITNKSSYENRFWPIDSDGYDSADYYGTGNTSQWAESNTWNGNFALVGTAEFIYKADDYFYFSGDDDVYLYINGRLALDLGGAHGVCYKEINLAELGEEYGLVEGQPATFTFFYMERCSDNSNFSMRTNIDITAPSMTVEKDAYTTNDQLVTSGSAVPSYSDLIYDFVVRNTGNTAMTNIVIKDSDAFGNTIYFGGSNTNFYGNGKAKLDISGPFTVWLESDPNNKMVYATYREASDAISDITLGVGDVLHVKGLRGKFTPDKNTVFTYENELYVEAQAGEKQLTANDTHKIYSFDIGDTSMAYVVDFGLPMTISRVFDSGFNAVDYIKKVTLASGTGKYGTVALVLGKDYSELGLTYTLTSAINGYDIIVLDIDLEIGETKITTKKHITIIPATSVYYEDSFSNFITYEEFGTSKWTVDGTTESKEQSADRVGMAENVYGYDQAYDTMSKFSLGSAHKVTVSGTANYATAKFSFFGTGFDVISATTNTSGTIVVSVKSKDGSYNKNFLVDTYYGYTKDADGNWTPAPDTVAALWQIPVMKVTGLDYGEYEVTITAAYADFFSHGQNGGESYDFWLDAIRIYDPAGAVAGSAGDSQSNYDKAYADDGEGWPTYTELRDMIIGQNGYNPDNTAGVNGAIFIDGQSGTVSIADYTSYGPKNELYLAKGQAIAFRLDTAENLADLQIAIKNVIEGENSVCTIKDAAGETIVLNEAAIATATDMYYSIKDLSGKTVVIMNTGDGILSITNLKATFTTNPTATAEIDAFSITVDESVALSAVSAVDEVLNPKTPFEPGKVEVKVDVDKSEGKTDITVITTPDVEEIEIDGEKITDYETDPDTGNRIWKTEHDRIFIDDTEVSVVATDKNGNVSAPVTAPVVSGGSFGSLIGGFIGRLIKNIFSALFR